MLLTIFDLATASDPFKPTAHNFHRVVLLTHVSRRWMKILLSCGTIWSNIHIYGQNFDTLNTQVERCQQASLYVSIRVPSQGTTEPLRFSELQKNVQAAADLIRERRDQVTRLHVRMECRSFQQLLGCEWPRLKAFVLVDDCSLGSSSHGGGYVGGLPRLKVLSIDGGSNWPMKLATHITTFKLQGPIKLELVTLAEFFRGNALLESLELTNLNVRVPSRYQEEEAIELPHLKRLLIRDATCGCVLALLNLPSLHHLRVSSRTRRNPWSDPHWSGFYSRLSITRLDAQYHASLRERITVVGSNGSDTRSFRLTEFSPNILGTALLKSLSGTSLSSVTSVSLIKDMPDGSVSSALITAICDLLEHLPRVECMRLSPTRLAIGVLGKLRGSPELCPELRELEVTVTDEACEEVVKLVGEMLKVRAGGSAGKKMRTVELLHPNCSQQNREAVRDRLWKEAGLQHLCTGNE